MASAGDDELFLFSELANPENTDLQNPRSDVEADRLFTSFVNTHKDPLETFVPDNLVGVASSLGVLEASNDVGAVDYGSKAAAAAAHQGGWFGAPAQDHARDSDGESDDDGATGVFSSALDDDRRSEHTAAGSVAPKSGAGGTPPYAQQLETVAESGSGVGAGEPFKTFGGSSGAFGSFGGAKDQGERDGDVGFNDMDEDDEDVEEEEGGGAFAYGGAHGPSAQATQPGYMRMHTGGDAAYEDAERSHYLMLLDGLVRRGVQLSRTFGPDDSLQALRMEYERHYISLTAQAQIDYIRNIVLLVVFGLELLNGMLGHIFYLKGWGVSVKADMDAGKYDAVLEQLARRYAKFFTPSSEYQLGFMLLMSGIMFHVTSGTVSIATGAISRSQQAEQAAAGGSAGGAAGFGGTGSVIASGLQHAYNLFMGPSNDLPNPSRPFVARSPPNGGFSGGATQPGPAPAPGLGFGGSSTAAPYSASSAAPAADPASGTYGGDPFGAVASDAAGGSARVAFNI